MPTSAFFEFVLPHPTTWYYVGTCAIMALFYQFTRPLAVRNFDLVALIGFAPGLLCLDESRQLAAAGFTSDARQFRIIGYSGLLGVSVWWFVRALVDLSVVKRARISPNLATPGLFWLGGTLLLGLSASTLNREEPPKLDAKPASSPPPPDARSTANSPASRPGHQFPTLGETSLAVVCHAVVVILLFCICRTHFQDVPAGAGTGVLYLLLPSTAPFYSSLSLVWPPVFLLGALLAYRRVALAGALLGLAAGTSWVFVALFPVWLRFYSGRGAIVFLRGFVLSGLAASGLLAVLGPGLGFPLESPGAGGWPWKAPTGESIWTGAHWAYRLPVFVAFVGFALGCFIWPAARNLGQLIALSAAILLGLQFWFADGGGRAITWFTPLLVLMAFRPTTLELRPPESDLGRSWLLAILRWVNRRRRGFARPGPIPSIEVNRA